MVTTSDMLTHPWIMSADSADSTSSSSMNGVKKKKSQIQIKGEYQSTHSN